MARFDPLVNSLAAGELAPEMIGRADHEKYFSGCLVCLNFVPRPYGTAYRRPGTRHVRSSKFPAKASIVQGFDFNGTESQSYMLEFGDFYMRVHKDRATVLGANGQPYELVTPWTAAQVARLRFWQSADVLYVVHPNVKYREIVRKGHADWTISEHDTRVPGHDWAQITDSNTDTKTDGKAGDTISIPAGKRFEKLTVASGQDAKGAACWWLYLGNGIFDNTDGATAMTVTFADTADAPEKIESVHNANGVVQTKWMKLSRNDSAPEEWTGTNWPGFVGCYQSRLVLASTPAEPLDYWMSRTDEWGNFLRNTSTDGTPLDDDAIWKNVQGTGTRMNPIQWLIDQADLLVGTNSSELIITSGSDADPVTPARCQTKRQSAYGSSGVPALLIGSGVVFVSRTGRKVRRIAYDWQQDNYQSAELSLLASHITGTGVTSMAYAVEPDGVIWCVREDGALIGCTYLPDQNVVGWHRHRLGGGGVVESISTIPGERGDELWMVVRREVAGATRRDIEVLEFPFDPLNPDGSEKSTAADGFYVDSGLSYSGAPTATLSGLDHLEGRTVQILGDGIDMGQQVVTGGAVTLAKAVSTAHVGLGYVSDIAPMPFDVQGNPAALLNKKRRVTRVNLRLAQSVGGKVRAGAYDPDATDWIALPTIPVTLPPGAPPPLYTGQQEVPLADDAGALAVVTLRQDRPLPMTLVCVVPTIEVTG